MNMIERIPVPVGVLAVSVFRHADPLGPGVLIDAWEEKNLIVDGAKSVLASLLGGAVTGKSVTQIGFGTNGAAPVGSNTSLTGAFVKNTGAATYPAASQVRFPFTLATTEGNGLAIIEFGLLTTDSTLFSRRVRGAAIAKDNTISFSGNWTISF